MILAGRSGRSNEELTFKIAQPEEMWFHAKGSAGAHVVSCYAELAKSR